MERQKLYTIRLAAEYIGLTHNQFLNEINFKKTINPKLMGRDIRVFTKPQLDQFKERGFTKIEVGDDLMDIKSAAQYLGVSVERMGQLVYVVKEIPVTQFENTLIVFEKRDLDAWRAKKEAEANRVLKPKEMKVPAYTKDAVMFRLETEGISMYQLVATLWQSWLDGQRTVPPLLDSPAFRAIPKASVYVRIDERLVTAVTQKCKQEKMKLPYVTAQLLAQWARET